MIPKIVLIIVLFLPRVIHSQVPSCVKEKCERILLIELGQDIFEECIEFIDAKVIESLDTITNFPCEANQRHDYHLIYKFSYPNEKKATFLLQFQCSGFNGNMNIQSYNFLRKNQTDLPQDFSKKGLNILPYENIKNIAYEKDSFLRGREGILALTHKEIYWVFEVNLPAKNKYGDAELFKRHSLYIDPYNGKIHSHQIQTY